MALQNEILVGHFARGLQKLTAIKGPAPAVQLGGDIVPVIPLPLGVEYRALDSWNRFSGAINITAGAGQVGGVRLRNPLNSGAIAVIEKLLIAFQATDAVQFRVDLSGAVELPNGAPVNVSNQ